MSKLVSNTQRLLKRMDRALSGPIVEFSEQFLYGHREILMRYAGMNEKAMLTGSIEHGWAMDSGRGIRKLAGGRYLYLSWSQERVDRSGINEETTIPIGAPFIYAYDLVSHHLNQFKETGGSKDKRVLFFPVHGNEYSQQNTESQIALFSEYHDPFTASVCLYWAEYINPMIYSKYQSAGFRIFCSGFSGQMEHTGLGYSARKLAGSPIGGRPNFLLNTIAMLATHDEIVFGGIGTSLFYAGFMDKKITLLHEYLNSSYLDMEYENGNSFSNNPEEMRYVNFIANEMGCHFNDIDYNTTTFRDFAKRELGINVKKSATELNSLFRRFSVMVANPQSQSVFNESVSEFHDLLIFFSA